jgi:hypothetical protein
MRNIRLYVVLVIAMLPFLAGCATIKAAAKEHIRQAAYEGADKVLERVLDKLELSPEAKKDVADKAQPIIREEIDKILSNDRIDEANK